MKIITKLPPELQYMVLKIYINGINKRRPKYRPCGYINFSRIDNVTIIINRKNS